jgi:hypothetical protein
MKMVCYAPQGLDCAEQILQHVKQLFPANNILVFNNIAALKDGLRKPSKRPALALFMVPTPKELMELVNIGWMLNDIRTIVLLPDHEDSTITMGHLLTPSFLTFCDADIEEVRAVLNNIVKSPSALESSARQDLKTSWM